MRRTYSVGKRLMAMVLSLVLVLSLIPVTGIVGKVSAADLNTGIISSVTDRSTLHSWRDAFNPTNLNTEHAGGVWTDKSVLSADDIAEALGNIAGLEVDDENFLVVLSALAANSVVVGQGATPTDTVFVLDVSGSMSDTDLRSMVAATNDAIHSLLTGNEKSRVGVVLYSSAASVLLPLGRYTPVTETQGTSYTTDDVIEYIELSNSQIRAARVRRNGNSWTYIKNENGNNVTTAISTGGGTYIQGGLWGAWELFEDATVTDQRAPVLVLMSDGAPTFVSNDFHNVPDSYESGDGNSSGNGEGFLTQLTAAYVKAKIAEKYSKDGFSATGYMYTLGLGLSTSNNTVSVAQAVLDTSKIRDGMEDYWDTYLALANKNNKTMSVSVYEDSWRGSSTTNVTVTYNTAVSSKSQMAYVDKYFSADKASDLSVQFQQIVNEISLRAGYYVTRLDDAGTNASGYVTFVDEIGTGMEVKQIKGILIGDTLYTGQQLAQAMENGLFGSVENPTTLGDNLVWAVKERLRITDTNVARELLSKAYAAKQIYYDAATGAWSNYIAWFGDADGRYVGFWDAAEPNAAIPTGAVYANICYGMLGATTNDQTAHASDMMYVAIQVSKKVTKNASGVLSVEDRTPQTVTFRIPAGLLPTVTYQISVDVGNNGQIVENSAASMAYKAAKPIRLVYEVGVHSALTPENISQFVREGYQAKDEHGNFYLYTNAWNWSPVDGSDADFNNPPTASSPELKDTGRNAITYAYFEPGEDNEHYYFTEDELIYVKEGAGYTLYEGNTKPSGTYYQKHLIYTATANSQNPGKEVVATITAHFEQLSDAALQKAVQNDGASTWYVPKGTMHRNMHDHNLDKTEAYGNNGNVTGSFFAIRHQLVDMAVNGDISHHYELVYMGNNARVTYAPAQGVSLTKEMAAGETADGKTFAFTLTVEADEDGKVTLTRGHVSTEATLAENKLQLTLAAGETVLITGLDTGAGYVIQENRQEGFRLSGIAARNNAIVNNADGTVSDQVQRNTIHSITYTNAIQHYGSLRITKDVTYLKNSQPTGANNAQFPVKVTLAGMGGEKVYVDGAAVTLQNDGTYTFRIADGQSVLITGIHAETAYTVEELLVSGTRIPAGFDGNDGYTATQYSFAGTVKADTTDTAALKNEYEPDDVVIDSEEPKITVTVDKTLTGEAMNDWSFDFELLYYNGTSWEPVVVGGTAIRATATKNNPAAAFNLEGITISSAGVHYFRVAEVIPTQQMIGMTYDRTFHDFKITVADDLSGQLAIRNVEAVQHAQVGAPEDKNNDGVAEHWTVTTAFTNTFSADSTKLTIEADKTLYNETTGQSVPAELKDGQFRFTLYKADRNFENLTKLEDTYNGIKGEVIFSPITYAFSENGAQKTYYYVVKETSESGNGYTVDDAVYKIAVTVEQQAGEGNSSSLAITAVTVQKNDLTAVDVTAAVLAGKNILDGAISFRNTYKAAAVSVKVEGTKNLFNETPGANGAAMTVPSGLFSFKLTALDGAPMNAGNTSGYQVVQNSGSGFQFLPITYTQTGTYHYTVSEEAPTAAGYRKDITVHNITVVVTDDGAGNLLAAVIYNGQNVNGTTVQAVFNNTYYAEPVTDVVLKGSKELTVPARFTRSLKAGEFSFTLTKPDGTTKTVTNDANGKFAFSALTFDKLGVYGYTVTEVGAGTVQNGVTYDTASYKVTVTVTDTDKDGKLESAVAYEKVTGQTNTAANEAAFVNSYAATSATVQLTARKYLTGRDLAAGEFSFTLKMMDGTVLETVKNDENGMITFSALRYDQVIDTVYKIVENKLDENGNPLTPDQNGNYIYKGVTYSQMEYTVSVKVTDNGTGALVAAVTSVDGNGNEVPVQFFNRYQAKPVTVELAGGKTLEDKTSTANKKSLADFDFAFVLTDVDGNEIQTVPDNDADGFRFAGIEFAQMGQTVYYIYERNTGAAGVTYDTARFKVTVQITDDTEGQLVAAVGYEKVTAGQGGTEISTPVQAIEFVNTYEADPAGVWISGSKTLTNVTPGVKNGVMATPAGMFSFRLAALNGAPLGAGNSAGYEIVKNDADGTFAFTVIHYTQEGTYKYTVTEEEPHIPGVTKDAAVHTLTVVVTDDGTGRLVAAITYNDDAVSGNTVHTAFSNTYLAKPVTGIVLSGNKLLEVPAGLAHSLKAGDFSFTLTKPNGAPETVKNDANGKFVFSPLDFDTAGIYTYTITEVNGGSKIDGITYDGKTITVVIQVVDNGAGQLIAKVNGVETAAYDVGTFRNYYTAQSVNVTLSGEKKLEDHTSLTDKTLDDFDFRFVLADGNNNILQTVTDNGSGYSFSQITYTAPTQQEYLIYELDEAVPGVTYDTVWYKVLVKVTDNGEGALEAEVSYEKIVGSNAEKADAPNFINTYAAKKTSVTFAGIKTFLGGRDLKENEFSFILKDAAGREIETAQNDADGNFTFTAIEYTAEGTYVYTLEEVAGDDSKVTYDSTKYTLTVTVKDVNGELEATLQVKADGEPAEEYGFTNLFKADTVKTTITVEKELVNNSDQTMGLNGFRFDLTPVPSGTTVSRVSDENGIARFELEFTVADVGKTFTYALSEYKGSVEGMTYSNVVYQIQVEVTQNRQTGELVLHVTRDGEPITENAKFINTYTPPVDDNPKTGYETFVGGWFMLMSVSAISLLAVLVLAKKERKQQ